MLYTPPVTPRKSVIPECGSLTLWEGATKGRTGDWGEVVTRYPYENVGMDHLLSMEKDLKWSAMFFINVLLSFERTDSSFKKK